MPIPPSVVKDDYVGIGDRFFNKVLYQIAQMAELVDALVSGTSIRKYVQVRVLFWALLI